MDTTQYNQQEEGEQDDRLAYEKELAADQADAAELETLEITDTEAPTSEQAIENEKRCLQMAIDYIKQTSGRLVIGHYLAASIDMTLSQYLTMLQDCAERLTDEQWQGLLATTHGKEQDNGK